MTERAARRGRPGHDHATVLRRAIEVFNRQGYEATSMGDLARELGVGKSAIYHHVPSKQHLLAEALDEALVELEGLVAEAVEGATGRRAGTAYDRLIAVVHQSVLVLDQHQPAVTLLLRVRGNSEVELDALRRRRAIDARLADLVRAAVAEGTLRADVDADLVSRLLFGMVNSLVEWFDADGTADAQRVSAAVTAICFEGLRRTPDGPGEHG